MKDINVFPEIPHDVLIGEPIPIKRLYEPSFEEIKPGLRLELATEDDADLLVDAMEKSGLYKKEDALYDALAWLSDPNSWGVKTIWKDRILQLEMYHFSESTVYTGFQTHLERRLPLWFWQQVAKQLIKVFIDLGMKDGYGYVRSDRRDWVEEVWKKIYNNEEVKSDGPYIHLHNTLQSNLNGIGEWPKRRTVPGWKFEKEGYTIKEMAGGDVPETISFVKKSWGESKRKELALKVFDQDRELCNATFFITLHNEEIMGCAEIRERNSETGALFYIHKPTYEKRIGEISLEAMARWCKLAGYKKLSVSIEEKLYERVKDIWAEDGWKLVRKGFDIVFLEQNVDEMINAYS